jgi:hypothetical protein
MLKAEGGKAELEKAESRDETTEKADTLKC